MKKQKYTKKTFKQRLARMKEDFHIFSNKAKDAFNIFSERKTEVEEIYDHVTYVTHLCENVISLQQQKKELKQELEEIKNVQNIYVIYEKFSKDKKEKVEKIWSILQETEEERENLKNHFQNSSVKNSKLKQYEKQIPSLLKEIEEMEEKQRKTKMDLDYLEGERADLQFSKEKMEHTLVVSRKISIGFVIGLTFISLLLVLCYSLYDVSVVAFGSVLALISLFVGTWLYILQRRIHYELQKNSRLQNRAVELLNKTKLRYVHYTRFLDYEYDKLGVHNLHMLEYQWSQYCEGQKQRRQYQRIASQKSQLELELWEFIEEAFEEYEEPLDQEIEFLFDPNQRIERVHELNLQYKKQEMQWEETKDQLEEIQQELRKLKQYKVLLAELPQKVLDKCLEEIEESELVS